MKTDLSLGVIELEAICPVSGARLACSQSDRMADLICILSGRDANLSEFVSEDDDCQAVAANASRLAADLQRRWRKLRARLPNWDQLA